MRICLRASNRCGRWLGGGWWPITRSDRTMPLKGCRQAYSANDWRPNPLFLNCKLDGGAYATNTIGNSNTLLGFSSQVTANLTNATAIGANASVTQSNSLVLGSINGVNGASADTK